jgi:hypothetical protein
LAKYLAILLLSAALSLSARSRAASPAQAQVDCEVLENGKPGSGSFRVLSGATAIAKGSCGRPAELAPGRYVLEVTLDGAVDAPSTTQPFEARAGQLAKLKSSFETGELFVEVTRDGRRGVASVKLVRAGRELATLSAGVASRVSVGTYTVLVESRSDKRAFEAVTIARLARRTLTVDFSAAGAQASP